MSTRNYRQMNCSTILAIAAMSLFFVHAEAAGTSDALQTLRQRPPQDEVIYLIMPDRFDNADPSNDRGGLKGDRLKTGYDPTDKAFYHGGDLKGVLRRLDYIRGLGATAIWLTPVLKNKPIGGAPGHENAGYHGYYIVDFTSIDPHLGTNADYKQLVDRAHARGMKVYMDIVVNHTADVIKYRECPDGECPYRSRADYPYTREGGRRGKPINDGFMGDAAKDQTDANFSKLTSPNYAYTPYVPKGEEHEKVPDWLNDPIYYHNRGNSTFRGESEGMGDFGGLDDVYTENPRVVRGFIEIYGDLIDKYRFDGFRIDTEKHVDPQFWHAFIPAMLARAKADGIPNFHIFGEVMESDVAVDHLARRTREDGIPAVMDYAFAAAVRETVAGTAGTEVLAQLFADDVLYQGGAETAMHNATLIGNYDIGRFPWFVRTAFPGITDDELLKRDILAHAMLLTLRGVPTIYYGDEQGFPSTGNDQAAREDMFASKVSLYNSETLVGTTRTTATSSFATDHPLYLAIKELARLRAENPALREGRQIVRNYSDKPGLLAISRIDPATGREILIAYNTSLTPLSAQVEVDAATRSFSSLHGSCAAAVDAPASYRVELKPLDYIICSGRP
jgi:glycosidase